MFVLTKIFGDYPQVKILETFADHFDEDLSIQDIIWLTDIPETTIYRCISKLSEEKILLEGSKVGSYRFNKQRQEVKIVISLVNYIVSEKLADRLEERGLRQLEEHEIKVN